MKFISNQQVLFINARLISKTGGETGLRDLALLESAVARPQASFDGKDLYPGLYEKAGALLDSLVNNHLFVDGNKRTGITAAAMFLRFNGLHMVCSQDELEAFTMQVASSHPPIEQMAGWLKEHTEAI